MKLKMLLGLVAGVFLSGATAYAHHSFAAVYNSKKEIKLDGKIVQLLYRNPHSYVQIEAADENGVVQRWSVEWAGTSQLSNRGITQETLKINDAISIVGRPSRVPGEYRLLMVNLTRPADGFSWGTRAGEIVD